MSDSVHRLSFALSQLTEKVAKGMPGLTNGTAQASSSSSSSEDSDAGKSALVKVSDEAKCGTRCYCLHFQSLFLGPFQAS